MRGYLIGLGLAIAAHGRVVLRRAAPTLVWQPSIPIALVVLAIAQMGVHLVFFLHITTGPDNTNNVLALAFGVLIVFLRDRRLAVDHVQSQPQHDADGPDHADAALNAPTARGGGR